MYVIQLYFIMKLIDDLIPTESKVVLKEKSQGHPKRSCRRYEIDWDKTDKSLNTFWNHYLGFFLGYTEDLREAVAKKITHMFLEQEEKGKIAYPGSAGLERRSLEYVKALKELSLHEILSINKAKLDKIVHERNALRNVAFYENEKEDIFKATGINQLEEEDLEAIELEITDAVRKASRELNLEELEELIKEKLNNFSKRIKAKGVKVRK